MRFVGFAHTSDRGDAAENGAAGLGVLINHKRH